MSFLDNAEDYFDKRQSEVSDSSKGFADTTEAPKATSTKPKDTPTQEAPKSTRSFLDDPDSYMANRMQEVHAATGGVQAGPSQAEVLASATKDVNDDEFINKYGDVLNTLAPEEVVKFQKIQPGRVIPRNVWTKGYNWQKTQPTQWLPTRNELADMIYTKSPEGKEGGIAGGIKNMMRGVRDIGLDIASPDPAANARLGTDIKSFAAPMLSIPEEVGYTVAKMGAGGTSLTDYLHDDKTREENAYQRHIVDVARASAEKASHNNVYERFLTSPTAIAGYKALMSSQAPSVSDIKSQHPEMSDDQAAAYRDSLLETQANEYAQQIAAEQAPLNENVSELGTWFSPAGLGMGEMGLLMNAGKIGKGLKTLAETKLLTKEAINAKRAAELAGAQSALEKGITAAQKPSLFGKAAEGIKGIQSSLDAFSEANPTLSRIGEAAFEYAPAAALGYEATDHNAGGALAGLAGVAIGKKLGVGKLLSEAPTVVSDIDKARMMSAGGRVGTLEMAGANPESSKFTQALFGGGRGAMADKFINNLVDYGHEGVNMTALGLATGVLNSEDSDQMRQTLASGLMYGLGFKTLHKALGIDPAATERKLKQQDVDNYHRLKEASPETRDNLLKGTDWNNVIAHSGMKMNLAQTELEMAQNSGNAKQIKEAADNLRTATAIHEKNLTANAQTRQAYGREVLNMFTEGNDLINGTLRAGQKNAGIAVLTTQQIYNQLRSRPENAAKTNEQLWEASKNLDGVYMHDGNVSYTDRKAPAANEGQFENLVFDPTKPTVIVNMDNVGNRMKTFTHSYYEAMSHELGHALAAIPEFRAANAEAERTLFGVQRPRADGTVEEYQPGLFTPAKLVEMFQKEYLGAKGYTPEDIQQWADNNGMWDRQNNRFNEQAIANYMKEEILAGLTGANLMPKVKENGLRHVLDWASIQAQNNVVASAINRTVGYGGKLPHQMSIDTNTGLKFTPQQLAANRDAIRQMRKLNGMVSEPISGMQSAPAISKLELLSNKGLWSRYGKDSGLLKTEMRATVYDASGKAIGSTVIADPAAKEGSWSHTSTGVVKDSGYGDLPAGVSVPDGGSVRISREIVMKPDGQTPEMLTPKEAKTLQDTRTGMIRDALANAYEGEEGGFRSTSSDGLSWDGTFTAKQIQAIRDLPENVIPKSLKDTILRMNALISEGAGKRMFIDYAAMMNDNGRYKAFAPKIYEVVPISMGLSKEGNFYIRTASVTRMNQKLKLWQQRLPGRLSMWNGDADAFFRDFSNIYLKNWQEGRPGETGLDPDPKVALQKKSIFADFLNFATKDTSELHDRTTIPRKKGDARDKDPDRIIMSVRADHVRDMIESSNDPLPIDYRKGKFNLMPAKKGIAEENGLGYQGDSTPPYREPKYETTNPPRLGFRSPRTTPQGHRVLQESPILAEAFRALDRAEASGGDQSKTSGTGLKPQQEAALRKFAQESGVMETPENVAQWGDNWAYEGRDAGTEHQTLLGSGERLSKRSDAPYHDWRGYLERILLHNMMFPDTAPRLEKFHDVDYRQEDINGKKWEPGLYAETSQPWVDGRHADPAKEIKPYMESLGFVSDGPMNYYHPELGVHVNDLHPGNAYVQKDAEGKWKVRVFDPMMHMTGENAGDAEVRARVAKKLEAEQPQDLGSAIQKAKDVIGKPENMPTQFKPAQRLTEEEASPKDERFVGRKSGIQFMPAKKLDEAHAKAIESGDMEEAQRLVDEKARQAGYKTGPVFHGTASDEKIKIPRGMRGVAAHVTTNENAAWRFADEAYDQGLGENPRLEKWLLRGDYFDPTNKAHLKRLEKTYRKEDLEEYPLEEIAKSWDWENLEDETFQEHLKEAGFSGYKDRENEFRGWDENTAVFYPEDIKSADPATYDNEGKLIPLSQRFDTTKSNINYKPAKKTLSEAEGGEEAPSQGSKFIDDEPLRALDAEGDKKATQVNADSMPYPVNPNEDSVTLPPRWGMVNKNIVGMPRSFKQVSDIINRQVDRLKYVASQKPDFAQKSARFYRDMAESATKMSDAMNPKAKGLDKWLLDELNLRFLALGSPRTAVAANATKSSGSAAGAASGFEPGYKIGFGDQAKGARDTYRAWEQGGHFDLNLPGVQDKVRSFYLNGLAELIEMAQEAGDQEAVDELTLRAGKSLRSIQPDESKITPEQEADVQRLLDGKATIDMWDMAAKGFAWPGYLLNKAKRNSVKQPFQWTQDKFAKTATLGDKAGQQVLKELGYTNWDQLRYQEARALRIDGNSDWNEHSWEERKQQPFDAQTPFTYFTEGTESGLTPGGGGPLYDAQQGINGLLADRLNELGMAGMFGKTKLKARNAQEILWALEKLDNPVKANNDLSLFQGTFDPFIEEVRKLRQGLPLDKKSRGANVLAAMDRAYNQMARQVMPLEVVTAGTSPQAERVQSAIAAQEDAGDKNAVQTITHHVASGLHDKINELATKHGLDVTVDSVNVGKGGYTEGDQVNVAPNMRLILRGAPEDTRMVLEALSRSLDQDGGNIMRKPTVRELNDANVKKNFILTLDTNHLDKADRDKMFLDLAGLKDSEGNSFLTGFTETDNGVAIGDQFYGGNMEDALTLNSDEFSKIMSNYKVNDYELGEGIVDMFFRGQPETKASKGTFQTDLDQHIADKLAAAPRRGVQFPQETDAAALWSQRADDLFAKLPEMGSKTKQDAAKIKLKSDLEAAVLRGVIDEATSDQLKVKYGFKDAKTEEE